jgi:hypothetical protein
MGDLKKLKKDDLINLVEDLQEKVANIKVEDTEQDTNAKVQNLIAEINRLQEELKVARESEKFVAIENLSLGRVWLYAPESKTGREEDKSKGRLLKQPNELAIVPSYWMATFIADRAPAFKEGELRLNNERGKKIAPHLTFEDFDLPEEFLDAAVPNDDLEKAIHGKNGEFYDLVEKYKNNVSVLNRVYGLVDRAAYGAPEKSKEKSILEGYVSYLDEIIHPTVETEEEAVEGKITI